MICVHLPSTRVGTRCWEGPGSSHRQGGCCMRQIFADFQLEPAHNRPGHIPYHSVCGGFWSTVMLVPSRLQHTCSVKQSFWAQVGRIPGPFQLSAWTGPEDACCSADFHPLHGAGRCSCTFGVRLHGVLALWRVTWNGAQAAADVARCCSAPLHVWGSGHWNHVRLFGTGGVRLHVVLGRMSFH